MDRHIFTRIAGAIVVAAVAGCGGPAPSDEVVPVSSVPASLMAVARKHLPGYTIDTVYKTRVEGKEVYVLRGKDPRGKLREVEVAATGEVLGIE